jgi:GST-like protein
MIDLYSWTTPNGRKVHIMLEECGLAYEAHPIDFRKGDQFGESFLKISPNNKIPAIIDRDGPGGGDYALFESGAILMYLADKTGRFLPTDGVGRATALQWLMWQMGGLGPMFGQAGHFVFYTEGKYPFSVERFKSATLRLCAVLDQRLVQSEYVAGADYTIADMAIWPWCMNPEKRGIAFDAYPNVQRWYDAIAARDGVKRGLEVLEGVPRAEMDDKAWDYMFGKTQFQRH